MDLRIARATEDPSRLEAAREKVEAKFAGQIKAGIVRGELVIETGPERLLEVCGFLRDSKNIDCSYMRCLLGMDLGDCLEVIYLLYSISKGLKVTVRTKVGRDNAGVPSVYSIWKSADWHERETAEMFGIRFEGHPDLKTLLLKEDFEGHPLRKDFKLKSGDSAKPQTNSAAKEADQSGNEAKTEPGNKRAGSGSSQMTFESLKETDNDAS